MFRRATGSRISMPAARARVRAGAALLDAEESGWRDRISAPSLELADGSRCVLGQLHGEFRKGLFRARIWDGSSAHTGKLLGAASPEDLGFFAITNEGEAMADLDYAFLTRAWREELGFIPEEPTSGGLESSLTHGAGTAYVNG